MVLDPHRDAGQITLFGHARRAWLIAFVALGCGGRPSVDATPKPSASVTTPVENIPLEGMTSPELAETHFADLRQLSFGGENAEAYWSMDGKELIFQAHKGEGCDQIYRMNPWAPKPEAKMVSTGKGATTCAYFFPGNDSILYASTHLGGDACPPPPDRSLGYVWALYDSYDIFKAKSDGSNLQRMTETKGYDAEATVCKTDGSIVFTSVRDGDIDLYRMDADGKNVKRLTTGVGYDGGAFFSDDCKQIVWRASRPKGAELDDYKKLLSQALVRPSKLELYVANADGSEARQVTYLDAASFGPYLYPNGKRIIFSSNYGDPKGREFDLFAINTDGTDLERITHTKGFDGFPMFSPDGKHLAFASNRRTAEGQRDTNMFLAKWNEGKITPLGPETAAERVKRDVSFLADPARDGRGIGTKGLEASGEFIEKRMKDLGLSGAGGKDSFRQPFEVTTAIKPATGTSLSVAASALKETDFKPLAFSGQSTAKGTLVLAGYGLKDKALGVDDYKGVNVRNQIAVVRRFVPEGKPFEDNAVKRRLGDLRQKAWVAREQGAKALIVVDMPIKPADAPADWKVPEEAPFPAMHFDAPSDAGIPVVVVKRAAFTAELANLEKGKGSAAEVTVKLEQAKAPVFNVVGRLAAGAPKKEKGVVVIGAHYDHLGRGGHPGSLAPDSELPHVGADDNASGVAALLEAARVLGERKATLKRDVVFIAFSGEESGLLGSAFFTKSPPAGIAIKDVVAMINMDMVGRMRDNKVSVLGSDSGAEWKDFVPGLCDKLRVECALGGDGYGPSDQMSFYVAKVPVVHLFTGAHSDYHKPTDTVDRLNAAGNARIALLAADIAAATAQRDKRITWKPATGNTSASGDSRSFNASLGTIPDYSGASPGQPGVLLSGVRAGSAAEKGGIRGGDTLLRLGTHEIRDVRDLMFALNASKPGETVKASLMRNGKKIEVEVTFEESKRPR
jgi:Tol biopolymer transport system component/Zn-dependent M28 family amino/carboxypeptidase